MKITIHRYSGRDDPKFIVENNSKEYNRIMTAIQEILAIAHIIPKGSCEEKRIYVETYSGLGYKGVEINPESDNEIEGFLVRGKIAIVDYKNKYSETYNLEIPCKLSLFCNSLGSKHYLECFLLLDQEYDKNLFPGYAEHVKDEEIDNKWRAALRAADELKDLEDDWDSYGAKAPKLSLVKKTKRIISKLQGIDVNCPPDDVYAVDENEIIIEWKLPGKIYQVVYVKERDIYLILSYPDKPPVFKDLPNDYETWESHTLCV